MTAAVLIIATSTIVIGLLLGWWNNDKNGTDQ